MASITKGGTLPDTGVTKNEVYALVDNATLSAIVDADITSVGGAKFTTLSAIPAGAGIIPVANIDVGTTASKIVQLDGSAKLPAVDGSALTNVGSVVQVVNTITKTVVTNATATVIPYDNTPPQITEGDQYLSRTITPKASGNLLKIDVTLFYAPATGGQKVTVALFDGGADAVAAIGKGETTAHGDTACFTAWYVTSGTSQITFTVRAGSITTQRFTMNGDLNGNQIFNGVACSSITITEVKA